MDFEEFEMESNTFNLKTKKIKVKHKQKFK